MEYIYGKKDSESQWLYDTNFVIPVHQILCINIGQLKEWQERQNFEGLSRDIDLIRIVSWYFAINLKGLGVS